MERKLSEKNPRKLWNNIKELTNTENNKERKDIELRDKSESVENQFNETIGDECLIFQPGSTITTRLLGSMP